MKKISPPLCAVWGNEAEVVDGNQKYKQDCSIPRVQTGNHNTSKIPATLKDPWKYISNWPPAELYSNLSSPMEMGKCCMYFSIFIFYLTWEIWLHSTEASSFKSSVLTLAVWVTSARCGGLDSCPSVMSVFFRLAQ